MLDFTVSFRYICDMDTGKKLPAELLTEDEISRLLTATNRGISGVRNQALLVVLYRAGLRISEALDLKPSDLDPATRTIRVLHGKGDKARVAAMGAMEFAIVSNWMAMRGKHPVDAPLFCTGHGTRIQTAYIRNLMKRLARKAGITKRVHAHQLRHMFAVELNRQGTNIHDIKVLVGHSSIATTAKYLARLSPEDSLDAARNREWKGCPIGILQ